MKSKKSNDSSINNYNIEETENKLDINLIKKMFSFSLPFLISYFLQTLYGLADLYIIGQFDGKECTTAVSIGSQLMHMVTVVIVGLAMGATVLIGHSIGEGNKKKASHIIGNTITLFLGISIILAVVLFIEAGDLLKIMSTPSVSLNEGVNYLKICFIGIPFITAYNIISSIYKGLGDSKTPMKFVIVSCIANIALDYLFIGYFDMNSAGAALGTVISQTISVVVALIYIKCKSSFVNVALADLKPDIAVFKELLKIGIPISLQDGFIQVSFLIITIIVNKRGIDSATAVGIVEKLITFIFLVPSTLLSSVSAMASQYVGAKEYKYAGRTLKYAVYTGIIYGLIVGIIMQFAAEFFVGLFTKDATVVKLGGQYMHSYVWDSLFAGIHFSFSGYFCAIKKSLYSFIHNLISICAVRIPLAYIFSVSFANTLFPLGFASTLGSVISTIICIVLYRLSSKKAYAYK